MKFMPKPVCDFQSTDNLAGTLVPLLLIIYIYIYIIVIIVTPIVR